MRFAQDEASTTQPPFLGADFAGVLVRDGWGPYRRFTDALHQSCLAHLLRRARTLRVDHPRSPWAARVQAVLTAALGLRDRRGAQQISDHGLAVARGQLLARLGRLIDTVPGLQAARRFAAHLDREFPAVLAFLWAPEVDATNWRAEHAIRPAVVNRKICGGRIERAGARTPSRFLPVLSAPPGNVTSTSTGSSPHCCKRHGRSSLRSSKTCRDKLIPAKRGPGRQPHDLVLGQYAIGSGFLDDNEAHIVGRVGKRP